MIGEDRRLSPRALGTLGALFLATRGLYFLAGIRFDPSPLGRIQHYLDPAWLRDDLVRSLLWLHSQPPGYNAFLGIVLKLFSGSENPAFSLTAHAAGLLLAVALAATARALGVRESLSVLAAALFLASPAAVLYENLLFYTLPVALFLAAAPLAFRCWADDGGWRWGCGLASLLVLVVWTRSLFHPLWLLLPYGLLLLVRRSKGSVLAVAAGALLLASIPAAKNQALFGFFGPSSWMGMSAARMTVFQLPRGERLELVRAGVLSPVSALPPWSSVESYGGIVPAWEPRGVPAVDLARKPSGLINYNHGSFVEISRLYGRDAATLLRLRPGLFLRTLVDSFWSFFQPSSDFAPFGENLRRIEGWNDLWSFVVSGRLWSYDTYPTLRREQPLLHLVRMLLSTPLFTLAAFLVLLPGAARWGLQGIRNPADRRDAATILFLAGTILWVMLVGNLLEVGENNRFRFLVTPAMFVLGAFELNRWLGWREAPGEGSLPPPPDSPPLRSTPALRSGIPGGETGDHRKENAP